jgi:hypothetical protein
MSGIAPLGLRREGYIQVYTGAQNENVFTNEWLGPFWGFKRVVQTFKLTNSPRRFKPIDIYYHLYSGSKLASIKALEYVFDWAIKQDVMPIFTSEYIPKVMDFYSVSMANEQNEWLVDGMKNLTTLRIEKSNAGVNLQKSLSVLGVKHFQEHTYISLDDKTMNHTLSVANKMQDNSAYLISANARVKTYSTNTTKKEFEFHGYTPLKMEFYIPDRCSMESYPKWSKVNSKDAYRSLEFLKAKRARVVIDCTH